MRNLAILVTLATVAGLACLSNPSNGRLPAGETTKPEPRMATDPVALVDVHELMETVVSRSFDDLKKGIATEPANRTAWRAVYASTVAIGESGNLLLFRRPTGTDEKAWDVSAVALRSVAAELVKAAKKRDYAATKTHYAAVVNACNRCHEQFTMGEPKIEP